MTGEMERIEFHGRGIFRNGNGKLRPSAWMHAEHNMWDEAVAPRQDANHVPVILSYLLHGFWTFSHSFNWRRTRAETRQPTASSASDGEGLLSLCERGGCVHVEKTLWKSAEERRCQGLTFFPQIKNPQTKDSSRRGLRYIETAGAFNTSPFLLSNFNCTQSSRSF